jgi:G6PDH family F420-dependent oxidoreductase
MLEEAIDIIRRLWQGDQVSYWGNYYIVENARIYTLPEELPPIMVAAVGANAIELAGRIGDGLISTVPSEGIVNQFDEAGGAGKPHYGQVKVCWAEDEAEAERIAYEWWPNTALPGTLGADLPTPAHFEDAVKLVKKEDVASKVVCGPDKRKHLEEIQKMIDAGFENIYVHQIGPNQDGFFQFYQKEILPELR